MPAESSGQRPRPPLPRAGAGRTDDQPGRVVPSRTVSAAARGAAAGPPVLPTLGEIEAAVDHEAYERFAAGIRTLLGLDLTQYKRPQVWRRAGSFARQRGCASVGELLERCAADPELRTAVRDMITINVSEFFRNPDAWEALRSSALPDLVGAGHPLRLWSAGCSAGYEPYSLAMLVAEAGRGAGSRIQATDVDETILVQARAGAYAEPQMAGVSSARRARYFDRQGDRWVVGPELRGLVSWRRHDLLRDPFPVGQDLIACRNVVIYFTEDAKVSLYRRFAQALRMGGVLFIGATEAMFSPRDFGLQMLTSGIYRRVA
jgi:chemotaxis protein methyltransferase CheR